METVSKTVVIPKELSEVANALLGVVKDLKAKKSVSEIAMGNLTALMTALEGVEKLPEEVKSGKAVMALGVLAGELAEVLMEPAV